MLNSWNQMPWSGWVQVSPHQISCSANWVARLTCALLCLSKWICVRGHGTLLWYIKGKMTWLSLLVAVRRPSKKYQQCLLEFSVYEFRSLVRMSFLSLCCLPLRGQWLRLCHLLCSVCWGDFCSSFCWTGACALLGAALGVHRNLWCARFPLCSFLFPSFLRLKDGIWNLLDSQQCNS